MNDTIQAIQSHFWLHFWTYVGVFGIIIVQAYDTMLTYDAFRSGLQKQYPLMEKVINVTGLIPALFLELVVTVIFLIPLYMKFDLTGILVSFLITLFPVAWSIKQNSGLLNRKNGGKPKHRGLV